MLFRSMHAVASDGLLAMLRKEYATVSKRGTWAHSVLTQAFGMPDGLAVEVLEGRECKATTQGFLLPTQ